MTLAAAGCTTLVLCGQGDIVPIAWALHRRVRDPGRPFIVAGPRRANQSESVRSPASRGNVALALEAARRGTCCMRLRRKPVDLAAVVPLLRAADDVMLVICGGPYLVSDALLIRPAPVVVPPLASRAHELERIVDEYAADAAAELQATSRAGSPPETGSHASSSPLRPAMAASWVASTQPMRRSHAADHDTSRCRRTSSSSKGVFSM